MVSAVKSDEALGVLSGEKQCGSVLDPYHLIGR